jgi:hypothetical protein
VLSNPAKHGTFVILNRREVLAKNASGSDMKNLTITSRVFIGALDQLGAANVSIRTISNFMTPLRLFACVWPIVSQNRSILLNLQNLRLLTNMRSI